MTESHEDEHDTRHEGGDCKPLQSVDLDDIVNDYDKRACRSTYLDTVTAECRDDEAADDGCYKAGSRTHTAGDGEGDSQGEGNDTHHDTGDEVAAERLHVVMAQCFEECGVKINLTDQMPELTFSLFGILPYTVVTLF